MPEGVIKNVEILSKTSKSGNPYKQIAITFSNGYVYTSFLTNEQYIILSAVLNK